MNNYFVRIFYLLVFVTHAKSQNSKSGIYKTYADYNTNKLTYEVDCKTEKHEIGLNEFRGESYITVIYKKEKVKLKKDSIYGILNCEGPLIRFQGKAHFSLLDKGILWIFCEQEDSDNLNLFLRSGETIDIEKKYYFSVTGDGKLIALTPNNIKKVFPENRWIHDMLDTQFKNTSISKYDVTHKMFLINYKIDETIKNCCISQQ